MLWALIKEEKAWRVSFRQANRRALQHLLLHGGPESIHITRLKEMGARGCVYAPHLNNIDGNVVLYLQERGRERPWELLYCIDGLLLFAKEEALSGPLFNLKQVWWDSRLQSAAEKSKPRFLGVMTKRAKTWTEEKEEEW